MNIDFTQVGRPVPTDTMRKTALITGGLLVDDYEWGFLDGQPVGRSDMGND